MSHVPDRMWLDGRRTSCARASPTRSPASRSSVPSRRYKALVVLLGARRCRGRCCAAIMARRGTADRVESIAPPTNCCELIKELAVVHGRVTLSSGTEADYYIDLRRITLHREAAPLVGRLLRELTADWDYDAVGGLTLGADPVACARAARVGRDGRRVPRPQGAEGARHAAADRGAVRRRAAGAGRRRRVDDRRSPLTAARAAEAPARRSPGWR